MYFLVTDSWMLQQAAFKTCMQNMHNCCRSDKNILSLDESGNRIMFKSAICSIKYQANNRDKSSLKKPSLQWPNNWTSTCDSTQQSKWDQLTKHQEKTDLAAQFLHRIFTCIITPRTHVSTYQWASLWYSHIHLWHPWTKHMFSTTISHCDKHFRFHKTCTRTHSTCNWV